MNLKIDLLNEIIDYYEIIINDININNKYHHQIIKEIESLKQQIIMIDNTSKEDVLILKL